MMIIHAARPLFDWDSLEDSPSLQTIRRLRAALPDGKLLNSLRDARGKGRNDYPVSVLWAVVVLRVALRHTTTEGVLGELRRNEGLRRVVGIKSEKGVPKKWNVSRFEEVLGQEPHRSFLKGVERAEMVVKYRCMQVESKGQGNCLGRGRAIHGCGKARRVHGAGLSAGEKEQAPRSDVPFLADSRSKGSVDCRRPSREEGRSGAPGCGSATPARQEIINDPHAEHRRGRAVLLAFDRRPSRVRIDLPDFLARTAG